MAKKLIIKLDNIIIQQTQIIKEYILSEVVKFDYVYFYLFNTLLALFFFGHSRVVTFMTNQDNIQ